ncbi:hypothetical protein A2W24_06290 [Microgenomates group bacterium RBG_16_45_19]|nr:MAG: hypothetical protein A2W24_06290 [Microgenomates group bacterium RBG_16_45_19]
MKDNLGMVYVFTGDGKGKTSAAIGTVVRAVGAGMKVAWVAFYKQASWKSSEVEVLRKLGVEVYLMGKGFRLERLVKIAKIRGGAKVVDTASEAEHKQAAETTLQTAREQLGKADVLVLDEVNNAMADKLVEWRSVLELVQARKKTHVILTGRKARAELVEAADLVTEMKKVKHPYDRGKLAVRGLDF